VAGGPLDAVAAVLLDGLSYRRAGRMVGISKTEVGDSLDLLLGELAALGFCQPDGTFVTTLDDLRKLLEEMAATGEAVVVDGLATRVQRPRGWANQKVLYDAKRHGHTAQGLSVSTIWGDLLWVDGGWPGSRHEHELMKLAGLEGVLDDVEVASLLDRGFRGMARPASTGMPRSGIAAPSTAPGRPAGRQPPAGGAARAGGAVHRAAGRRLGAAPLARAAVPSPGRLPGRRRAHLPGPLAAPGPHMTRPSRPPSMTSWGEAPQAGVPRPHHGGLRHPRTAHSGQHL
jgi:DDE superfamily endonuclease